jgi:hypothetical protein
MAKVRGRCSHCSAEILPIVCIDVDGTISEYHHSLAEFCSRYWNIDVPWESWDGDGDFEEYLGLTRVQYREAKLAYRQGGFKRWSPTMPELTDLLSILKDLRAQQLVEVWITTTRPWMRLDSVDPDTRHWLDRNFPIYDHILYDDHKYSKLANLVDRDRVVAVVDDLPEMVLEASESFPGAAVMMIDRSHNRLAPLSIPRVHGLNEFAVIAREEVEQWWTR